MQTMLKIILKWCPAWYDSDTKRTLEIAGIFFGTIGIEVNTLSHIIVRLFYSFMNAGEHHLVFTLQVRLLKRNMRDATRCKPHSRHRRT